MNTHRSWSAGTLLGSALLLFVPACASTAAEPGPTPDAAGGHELEAARGKLRIAELELELAQKSRDEDQQQQQGELALAQAELREFEEMDAPDQLARERLSLTRSQDSLAEQEEELAQLEMTYAEVDLADKTREIVLRRNHRRVERAKAELVLEERELAKLEQHTLPREKTRLALAVAEKTNALGNAQRTAEIGLLEKQLALDEARAAVAKLEPGSAGSAP